MNLKRILQPIYGHEAKKYLRIMKLTWFLILALTLQTSASLWSQTTKMDVDLKNSSLLELFTEIENNSKYRFFYSNDEINVNREITIRVNNKVIGDILTEAFEDLPYSFKELRNNMILVEVKDEISQAVQQQKSITGKVTDESGQPLPGVTVVVKGTTNGAITDFDGNYTFPQAKKGDVLVFSFVGMVAQEIEVGVQNQIDITMLADAIGIEEVIAIGYGTQIKSKVTGAITTIQAEQLENRPITNVQTALQGAVPGLIVSNGNGRPGSAPGLDIRGVSTIGGSSGVLVLVDGMEASINDVDPNDIESMSVLKDAAAASVYGARAANGVILITTKSGKRGTQAKVTYKTNIGFLKPTSIPETVDTYDYMSMRNKARQNSGQLAEFTDEQIQAALNGDLYNTNWTDELYSEPSMQQSHSLGLSGGTEKSSYYMGVGYLDQEGILKGADDFARYNLRLKLDVDVNDWLTVGTNTAYTNRETSSVTSQSGRELRALPMFPVSIDEMFVVGDGGNSFNPVMDSESGSFSDNANETTDIQLYANLKLAKGLTFDQKFSLRSRNVKETRWRDAVDFYAMSYNSDGYSEPEKVTSKTNDRRLELRNSKSRHITSQSFLNYENNFDKHALSGLFGFQVEKSETEGFNAGRSDFLLSSLQQLDLGATPALYRGSGAKPIVNGFGNESSSDAWTMASLIGRLSYDYDLRYLVEFKFRYDGTSRFAEGNKWGFFPAVSVGWNVAKENFMENIDFLDMLKLRGSWGQLGDAFKVGNYASEQTIVQNIGYPWLNGTEPGLQATTAANPLISWETSTVYNLGVDANLWRGKLGVQAEYFINDRTDILGKPPVPTEFGLGAPAQNIRDVKSQGWELTLRHQNKIGDISYDVAFNISDQKNEVTYLGSTPPTIGNSVIDEGYSVNARRGWLSDGFIESQEELDAYVPMLSGPRTPFVGGIKLKDISGPDGTPDGIIDNDDKIIFDDNIQHYFAGMNFGVTYKGFSLAAYLNGVLDNDIIALGDQAEVPFSGDVSNAFEMHKNAFDPANPNQNADFPALMTGTPLFDYSDFLLRKADYVRLKNVSLTYRFNKNTLEKLKVVKDLSVYASVENAMILWTNYFAHDTGWDPELGFGGVAYPLPRTISFGLNVTF